MRMCAERMDHRMCFEIDAHDQIEDRRSEISREVRDFYDRMPYPAALTSLDQYRDLYGNPERRLAQHHLMWPTEPPRAGHEILIAGCGTSQAARHALREPDARITAIDVSETSLRHTRELQQKYELHNLELHQMSILDVKTLGKSFDQIVCTGVLHHLADPDLGLRSLRSALKPNGAMQIMVYATYGRTGIYMMQAYCRLLGITPSAPELRDLCDAVEGLSKDHPLAHLLRKAKDFQNPDALADTLLHPQDRAYTVPQIFEWLGRCGMTFGRWFEQAPYLPECGVLARTPHAARLKELPEPAQYAAAELFRGTMTQHSLIAYRNDRSTANTSIHFTGEQWRNYVPIRLPWTVCVRDRVPSGSVAVLLNRAHKHSDLILPINAAQNNLLDQIDGRRTLAEIVRIDGKDDLHALEFIQQLWHYDQIVFDASRVGCQEKTSGLLHQAYAASK
jgi:2-polyprenyl-3-methyl-5-hydroxy-6-metoxy-1,4-benzoquinol methylase